jgi:hypothetical protein
MNLAMCVGLYAACCKELGLPLVFPGMQCVDEALILLRIDENMRKSANRQGRKQCLPMAPVCMVTVRNLCAGSKTSWVSQTEASSARLIAAFMEWLALSTSPATQNQVGDWERDVQ